MLGATSVSLTEDQVLHHSDKMLDRNKEGEDFRLIVSEESVPGCLDLGTSAEKHSGESPWQNTAVPIMADRK